MKERLLRASLSGLDFRVIFVELQPLLSEFLERVQPPLSCREHYLKALTAGLLTSPLLHKDERYTLRWHYGQSLEILVDVDHQGGLRSTLNPVSEEEEMQIETLPGKLGVVRSSPTRRLNDGMVLADLCDPAQDLATFFNLSDQIPTFCRVVTSPHDSWGLLFQGLPGCDPETIATLEDHWKSSEISKPNLTSPKEISSFLSSLLDLVISEDELSIHSTLPPHSFCTCGKEKMRKTLGSFPVEELENMIRQDGGAQIDCHFCASSYRFEAQDIRELIGAKG